MNNEFFDALELIAREKGISIDYLIEKITNAITIAVKKDFGQKKRERPLISEER